MRTALTAACKLTNHREENHESAHHAHHGATLPYGCAAAGDAAGQQKTLKDQLVGAWTYVSDEFANADGTKQPSLFGANPKGYLFFDASGRYADIEMRPDRPKFKTNPPYRRTTSADEWSEATKAFAANFGTWSVNEADKTLVRHWEGSIVPNNEGFETKNSISLTGDELKLVGPLPDGSVDTEVFRRAK